MMYLSWMASMEIGECVLNTKIELYSAGQSSDINSFTVEPPYNEDLGTMKITLLYQVSCYTRVTNKKKKSRELGPGKLSC